MNTAQQGAVKTAAAVGSGVVIPGVSPGSGVVSGVTPGSGNVSGASVAHPVYSTISQKVFDVAGFNAMVAGKQAALNRDVSAEQARAQAKANAELASRTAAYQGRERFTAPLESPERSLAAQRYGAERTQQEGLVASANAALQRSAAQLEAKYQAEAEAAKADYWTTQTTSTLVGYSGGAPSTPQVPNSPVAPGYAVSSKGVVYKPISVQNSPISPGYEVGPDGKVIPTTQTIGQRLMTAKEAIVSGSNFNFTPSKSTQDLVKAGQLDVRAGFIPPAPLKNVAPTLSAGDSNFKALTGADVSPNPWIRGLKGASDVVQGFFESAASQAKEVLIDIPAEFGREGTKIAYAKNPKENFSGLPTNLQGPVRGAVAVSEGFITGGVGMAAAAGTTLVRLTKEPNKVMEEFATQATQKPVGFGLQMLAGEGIAKIPGEFRKIGSIKATPTQIVEAGRGNIEAAIAKDFPVLETYKTGKPIPIERQMASDLAKSAETFIAKGGRETFVTRIEPFNILKPSTYLNALTGKKPGQFAEVYPVAKTELVLKNIPSELAGKEIKAIGGEEMVIAHVTPGATPFVQNLLGLEKLVPLTKPKMAVENVGGGIAMRRFAQGIETGQFFAPQEAGKIILTGSKVAQQIMEKERLEAAIPLRAPVRGLNEVLPSRYAEPLKEFMTTKDVTLTGRTADNLFIEKVFKTEDVDFIARDAKKMIKEAQDIFERKGFKGTRITEAKHKGTFNLEVEGKALVQITSKRFPKTLNVEGAKVISPVASARTKLQAITNVRSAFRAEKDAETLKALTGGKIGAEKTLAPKRILGRYQAYVYYAGVGRETSLFDVLKGKAKLGFGSPKIVLEKTRIEPVAEEVLKPVSKAEVAATKKEFESLILKALKYERQSFFKNFITQAEKPRLSFKEIKGLLERAPISKWAEYRRIARTLDKPGTTQVGAGALSGLRPEYEVIKSVGSRAEKISLTKSRLAKHFDIGEVKIRYPGGTMFRSVFQRSIGAAEKPKALPESALKAELRIARPAALEKVLVRIKQERALEERLSTPTYPVSRLAEQGIAKSTSAALVASSISSGRFASSSPRPASSSASLARSFSSTNFPSTASRSSASSTGSGFSSVSSPASSRGGSYSGGSSGGSSGRISSGGSSTISSRSPQPYFYSYGHISSGPPTYSPPVGPPRRRKIDFNEENIRKKRGKKVVDVYIKNQKGAFKIASRVERARGIQLGKFATESTARQTFALRNRGYIETNEPERAAPELGRFRAPAARSLLRRLGEEVFVQRRKFAISSRGEKTELAQARRATARRKS